MMSDDIGPEFWLQECRIERDAARARVGELETDRDELLEQRDKLIRKDELLCNQNAALLVEVHDLKAALKDLDLDEHR